MTENELSGAIIDTSFHIHQKLGPGFLESVYEEILYYELSKRGLYVERQKVLPVFWDGSKLDVGFRSDILVEKKVIVELKSIEKIAPIHPKILLNYLKVSNLKLGLLINFNETLIKNGIIRIVNNL